MDVEVHCDARVGIESEQSALQGALTLYVRGKPSKMWVTRWCNAVEKMPRLQDLLPLRHLHFGVGSSFDGTDIEQWENVLRYFLRERYWVTLELHPRRIPALVQTHLCSNAHFIPLVSVSTPCLKQLGPNAALRIADLSTDQGTWRYPVSL